jgi:hypothetical protein
MNPLADQRSPFRAFSGETDAGSRQDPKSRVSEYA